MKDVKVLGSGCCNKCDETLALIEKTAAEEGVEISAEKITDTATVMGYGVMSTPGVVIDGEVVHSGSQPKPAQIKGWLAG